MVLNRQQIHNVNTSNNSHLSRIYLFSKSKLFREGDCYKPSSSNYCLSTFETCSAYPSSFENIINCQNKFADYLHMVYRCVPSNYVFHKLEIFYSFL